MKSVLFLFNTLLVCVFLTTTSVHAESPGNFYVGAMFSSSSYDYSDVDNSNGTQFYVGYRPENSSFGFELAAVDLGDAEITSLSGWELNISGITASVLYHTKSTVGQLGAVLKGGLYSFDSDLIIGGSTSDSESSAGLTLGAGVDYPVTRNFVLRADLVGYLGVEDYADDGSIFGGNFGVEVHF